MSIKWIYFATLVVVSFSGLYAKTLASSASGAIFELNTPPFNNSAKQDLAALFLKSYQCVKSVDKIESDKVRVEFRHSNCFIFDVARNAMGLRDAFLLLRDAWQKNYVTHTSEMNLGFRVPLTLSEFERFTDYKTWTNETIVSELKQRERKIFRNNDFWGHDIRVSEMELPVGVIPTDGPAFSLDALKEVEIAVSLGNDRVFFVYDQLGNLSSQAHFPRGPLLAPMACTGCHYDAETRTVSRFF